MALLGSGRPPLEVLPPINHPDFDKSRSEKFGFGRSSIMPPLSISTAPLASPSAAYSGPPPPYSCAPSTTESVHNPSGYFSPPLSTTRRSTRDEKDTFSTKTLPSLHEALGGDKSIPFSGPPSATQSNQAGSAPTTAVGQYFPDAPRGPPNPFSHISGAGPLAPSTAHVDPLSSNNSRPELHGQPLQPYSSPPTTTNNTHRSSAGSFSSFSRPHEPLTTIPPYASEASVPNTSYRDYASQPPSQPPPHPTSFHFESAGKFDDSRNPFRNYPQASYGETVKRHLESFDAELALNEISDASSRTFDFSRAWAQRHHQTNRSVPFAESAPSLQDIDDMLRQQHSILENLTRLRDVVVMQQNIISEERARAARGHMNDDHHGEEYKTGGFAGGDAKKRRGKAAPPGRCHSCNRAETPEWRRGPDGARTLCNACGLHYAKLTRKLGANKASSITGSNLRPKGLDPRSVHI